MKLILMGDQVFAPTAASVSAVTGLDSRGDISLRNVFAIGKLSTLTLMAKRLNSSNSAG